MSAGNPHQDIRWLRSQPTAAGFDPSRIDAENGILRDVVMVQQGPVKGHGVHLEEGFIHDLVQFDQASFGERGVKARFGHPGASDNTMGMQLGYFRNVRKRRADGAMQAIGDLHLLEAANLSPDRQGMRDWVLKMAAEAPDFLMSSIVFKSGGYYQKKANGHKTYIQHPDMADPQAGDVFVEFGQDGEHFYTDLVEEGAATNSLFQATANPHLFVAQAETFLDEHPHLEEFIAQHPEKVMAFLHRYGLPPAPPPEPTTKHSFSMSKFMDMLFGKPEEVPAEQATEVAEVQAEFAAAKDAVTALQTERDDLTTRLAAADASVAALSAQVADLGLQVQQLSAQMDAKLAEIEALKKQPAAEHTAGDSNDTALAKTATSKTPKTDALYAQYGIPA